MQSIKNIKSYFEQSIIIGLLLLLMGSFISLGFYVVEKSMYDLMGTYETPSIIYFSQDIYLEEVISSNEQKTIDTEPLHTEYVEKSLKEKKHTGVNNLAMVLDAKIEQKAHTSILWTVDRITIGLEYMADILSKTLQSS